MAQIALETQGYSVLEAAGGAEAVRVAERFRMHLADCNTDDRVYSKFRICNTV